MFVSNLVKESKRIFSINLSFMECKSSKKGEYWFTNDWNVLKNSRSKVGLFSLMTISLLVFLTWSCEKYVLCEVNKYTDIKS